MSRAVTRFRALLIALAVLALATGAVMASHSALSLPSAAADGLERAAEAAGKTVPVTDPVVEAPPVVQDDNEDSEDVTDEDQPADEAPADEVSAEHPDNHGNTVSDAAKGPTPAGSGNHGQYVRTIATDNHGHEVAAEKRPDPATKKPSR